jgi:hypothetical protein
MKANHNAVITATEYDKVDGRAAFQSQTKMLSLEHDASDIMAKVWSQADGEGASVTAALPLHQVLDLAIFACRGLVYFQDAYRYPKLYDPEHPRIERIGLQGSAMTVAVCTENPNIDQEIRGFSQAISDCGEMIGERIRVLAHLLEDMGY